MSNKYISSSCKTKRVKKLSMREELLAAAVLLRVLKLNPSFVLFSLMQSLQIWTKEPFKL